MTIRRISVFSAAVAMMLTGSVARAGSVTVPNTFTSGTPAQAAQVNANFSAVQTAVNDNDSRITALEASGSVTSARIANGTITFADWNQNACATNQIPKWNGAAWACAADADSGTVTSVATGSGLTGGPITGTGTISIATGGVTSTMIADAAVTTQKAKLSYLNVEGNGTYSFSTAGTGAAYCGTASHTASTSQVAFVDAAIAWSASTAENGSVAVLYSTDNGATWTNAFTAGLWTTNPVNGWASSTKSDAVLLTAGVTYRFAVGAWTNSGAFTSTAGRCGLRAVFAAR